MRSRSRHVLAFLTICCLLLALAPPLPTIAQGDATPSEIDETGGLLVLVQDLGDGGQPASLTREAVFDNDRFLFDRMVTIDPGNLTEIGQFGEVTGYAGGEAIYLASESETGLGRYLPEHLDAPDTSCPAEAANIGRLDTGDGIYVFGGVEQDLTPDLLEQVGTDQSNQPVYADPGAPQPFPELFFTDQSGLLRFLQTSGDGQPNALANSLAFDGVEFQANGDVTGSVNPSDLTRLGCAGPFPVFGGADDDPAQAARYVEAGGNLYEYVGEIPATAAVTEEPTEQATEEPTEEPTEDAALPSVLVVDLQDEEGNPIGGACWQLLQDGNVIQEACDTAEAGDPDPLDGRTGFESVPAGDYDLHQSVVPENSNPSEDSGITIPGDGAGVEQTLLVPVLELPTEEPTEDPTEQPTEAVTEEPTEQPTEEPTVEETEQPTEGATEPATEEPVETEAATEEPGPTEEPTEQPVETEAVTEEATEEPVETETATEEPEATGEPTAVPTDIPVVVIEDETPEQPTAPPSPTPTLEPTPTTDPDASPTQRPTEQLQAPAVIPTLAANVPPPPAVTAEASTTCQGNPGALDANGIPANLPARIQLGGIAYSLAGSQAPDEAGTLTMIGCVGPFAVASTDQADRSEVLYLRYTGTGDASQQVYRFEAATTFAVEFEVTGRAQVIQATDQQYRLTQIWVPSTYSSVTVKLFIDNPEEAVPATFYAVSVANTTTGDVIGEYTAAEATETASEEMAEAAQATGLNPDLTIGGQRYVLSNVYLPVGTTTNGFVTLYAPNGDAEADRLLGRDLRRLELFIYSVTGGG